MSYVLDILHERGFIKQIMGEDKLKEKMSNGPMTFYIGFDPTGDCTPRRSSPTDYVYGMVCKEQDTNPLLFSVGEPLWLEIPAVRKKTREMLTKEDIEKILKVNDLFLQNLSI